MNHPVPARPALRASIVVDYQNVHLTGHDLFDSSQHLDRHETSVDPLLFAQTVLRRRNAAMGPGHPHAVLQRVLVYRGCPSPEHDAIGYARNQAQQSQWERDSRVTVHLRPLKYYYQRDATGQPIRDVNGRKLYTRVQEKGIDVLCALALVREARDPNIGVVILASGDSDLEPAIQEARTLGGTRVETTSWWCPRNGGHQLRARPAAWNTRLGESDFLQVRDTRRYA